jgi:hypothetical protein
MTLCKVLMLLLINEFSFLAKELAALSGVVPELLSLVFVAAPLELFSLPLMLVLI